jgi:nicotinate-nucleotide--dimethylbenzimidazole phosphoribosyltransferase
VSITQVVLSPRDPIFRDYAEKRQGQLTKPTGALGALERAAVWLSDIQQARVPVSRPAAAIVFASDHPVSKLGVSAYPREVTPMMVMNLAQGGAAASVLARLHGVALSVVDVGAEDYPAPTPAEGVSWSRRSQAGLCGDLVSADAMDEEALHAAIGHGREAVRELADGTRLLLLGEMGIGNTTPASAIAARLLRLSARDMVGPGTGVSGEVLGHKTQVVEQALQRTHTIEEPLEVLRCLGGREIAALVGAIFEAAERGIGILVDGFIVSSAALVAVRHCPQV